MSDMDVTVSFGYAQDREADMAGARFSPIVFGAPVSPVDAKARQYGVGINARRMPANRQG
jgi:hypothetical protein